jgi:iron complex outermembrane receptor protein
LLAPPQSIFSEILGAPATGFDLTDDEKLSTQSTSIFAQDSYKFGDGFALVTGARGINEGQVYDYTSTGNIGTGDYTIATGHPVYNALAPFNNQRTELLWAAKAELQYQMDSDLLLFASFNRGAKAGNYNAPLPTGTVLTPAQMSYKAETLLAYEAGAKSTLLDGRAYLDGSVFDYDYRNYQAFSFSGVSGFTQNHPARSYGGEITLTIKPFAGLQVDSGLSLFHARVEDIVIGAGIAPRSVQPTFAPSQQFNSRVTYTLPMDVHGGKLMLGGNAYYTSSFYTDIQNFEDQRLPGYWLFDAQIAWHAPGGHWVAAAFVNNMLDKRYGTILFDLTTLCGCEEKAFGQPRFIGGKLSYTY